MPCSLHSCKQKHSFSASSYAVLSSVYAKRKRTPSRTMCCVGKKASHCKNTLGLVHCVPYRRASRDVSTTGQLPRPWPTLILYLSALPAASAHTKTGGICLLFVDAFTQTFGEKHARHVGRAACRGATHTLTVSTTTLLAVL